MFPLPARFITLIALALSLIATGPAVRAGEPPLVLTVVNMSVNTHYRVPLRGAGTLAIRFFHSYDREWVEERFTIGEKGFVPCEVRYASDSYDYRDTRYKGRVSVGPSEIRMELDDSPENKVMGSLVTRVAHTKSQSLILFAPEGAAPIPFTDWGEPGQQLRIGVGTE